MTNFKNSFIAIGRRGFGRHAQSRVHKSNKKSFGQCKFICLILLLSICMSLGLASFAQNNSNLVAMQNNPPAGPQSVNSGPAGPQPVNATNGNIGVPQSSVHSGQPASSAATLQQKFANNPAFGRVTSNDVNTSLLVQAAENDASNFTWLAPLLDWFTGGLQNDVSQGLQTFWNTTAKDFLVNFGAWLQQQLKQLIAFILTPVIQALTNILVQFAYNPDVSVGQDTFSQNVQAVAQWVRDLTNDLLLLFFILSIWRYWANAAWKGGSLMGAVARIIVAAAAITAWPTIYHYVILISNSLTQYLMDKNVLNGQIMSDAVATAMSKALTGDATLSFVNSLLSSGTIFSGLTLATPLVALAQLTLVLAIGLAIISSLVVFFTMKVIQIIIVVAAFVFGPFFLCLAVSPDTSSTTSSFIRAFVETCLWTFVWTIFLMLFVFALGTQTSGADPTGHLTVTQNMQSPWFILFLELGILQAMIQTPGYLSRGKISETGEFLEIFALWKAGRALGGYLLGADGKFTKAFRMAKRNVPWRKDESSMSLGGASDMPTAERDGKALTSLNNLTKTKQDALDKTARINGLGGVPGAIGRGPVAASVARAQAAAAMASGMVGASGGAGIDLIDVAGRSVSGAGSGGGTTGAMPGGTIYTAGGAGGVTSGDVITGRTAFGGNTVNPVLAAMAGATRNALAQFSTSIGGGYQSGSDIYANSAPLVQKTSLAPLGHPKNNPWLNTEGRRTGPIDCLTMYNLKSIRPGDVALMENDKNPNENAIDFDDSGTIKKIKHRRGAGAQEIGMLSAVAALSTIPYSTGKGQIDPRASSATNNSVKDARKWDPPIGRRISYALSRGNIPPYVRNLENDRLEREKVKARIEGSMAYLKGEAGNHYTKFLEWKFDGPLKPDDRALLAYTSENTDTTIGGFNLNWEQGINRLGKMGLDINVPTMGIASHEGITTMKPSEQVQAIPAVLQLMNGYLAEMGIRPPTDGAKNVNWDNPIHYAACDGVLRTITPQHVRAARAISDVAGIKAVTPNSVNTVLKLHKQLGHGEQSYAYEKTVLALQGANRPFRGKPA